MKRISKAINFPADLVAEIITYQRRNYISSFTGAVCELVRNGLNVTNKQQIK